MKKLTAIGVRKSHACRRKKLTAIGVRDCFNLGIKLFLRRLIILQLWVKLMERWDRNDKKILNISGII